MSKVKNFAVDWADSADQDLARIVEYIDNDSVIEALNVLARIKKTSGNTERITNS